MNEFWVYYGTEKKTQHPTCSSLCIVPWPSTSKFLPALHALKVCDTTSFASHGLAKILSTDFPFFNFSLKGSIFVIQVMN